MNAFHRKRDILVCAPLPKQKMLREKVILDTMPLSYRMTWIVSKPPPQLVTG